jgi:predicted RND superfamily exporter protein
MSLDKLIAGVSRIVFDHRKVWLVVFAILTALFLASASRMVVDAGFNKMVPLKHEYMKVYREYEKVFGAPTVSRSRSCRRTATSTTRSSWGS